MSSRVRRKGGGRRAVQARSHRQARRTHEARHRGRPDDEMDAADHRQDCLRAKKTAKPSVDCSNSSASRCVTRSCAVPRPKIAIPSRVSPNCASVLAAAGHPIISVDTKNGSWWVGTASRLSLTSVPKGIAIPYATICSEPRDSVHWYLVQHPGLRRDAIEKWWRTEGRRRYPAARDLAYAGGSNGYRCRGWKHGPNADLQSTTSLSHSPLSVRHPSGIQWSTVCSARSANSHLDSYETILHPHDHHFRFARRAHLIRRRYPKGVH